MKCYHSTFSLILICVLCSMFLTSTAKHLFIFTINDFHGHLTESKEEPGIAKLYSALKEFKKQLGANDTNSIIVSNGDSHQGTYFADITKGDIVSSIFKEMNIPVSSIGNHQFQYGLDSFPHWQKDGGLSFISANIIWKNGSHFSKPYQIVEIQGYKIAFIGATTLQTPYTTSAQQQVERLKFLQPFEEIFSHIQELKHEKKVDFIFALAHIGSHQLDSGQIIIDESKKMAEIQQLDGIFTAHSHKKVAGYVNGKPVIQACCYAKCIGVLKIQIETRKITPIVEQVLAKYPDIKPDEKFERIVKEQIQYYAQLGNKIVTTVNGPMDYEQIAQFICDKTLHQYEKIGLKFVIMNGGLIRINIEKGQISMNTLHSIIPFDNTLVFITLKGQILKKNIQHTKVMMPQRKKGKISGDVQNIKDDEFYKVGVTSFMHPDGDKYSFESAKDVIDTGILIRDLLLKYWRSQERIDEQL